MLELPRSVPRRIALLLLQAASSQLAFAVWAVWATQPERAAAVP